MPNGFREFQLTGNHLPFYSISVKAKKGASNASSTWPRCYHHKTQGTELTALEFSDLCFRSILMLAQTEEWYPESGSIALLSIHTSCVTSPLFQNFLDSLTSNMISVEKSLSYFKKKMLELKRQKIRIPELQKAFKILSLPQTPYLLQTHNLRPRVIKRPR